MAGAGGSGDAGGQPGGTAGTVRARPPERTWEAVADRLPDYGITRVADLTGLDCIGLPVWTADPASPRHHPSDIRCGR